jgi:hypothetical protein
MNEKLPPFRMGSEEAAEWLAARKKEGLKIDPENVEVAWHHAQILEGVMHLH